MSEKEDPEREGADQGDGSGKDQGTESSQVDSSQVEPSRSDPAIGSGDLGSGDLESATAGLGDGPLEEEELNEFGFRPDEMFSGEEFDQWSEGGEESEGGAPIEELVEPGTVVALDNDGSGMEWYILKVSTNRETSVCDNLKRSIRIAGMDAFFEDILVPTEEVRTFTRAGKQRIVKQRLYPGYVIVKMKVTDESWSLVREVPGVSFTGASGSPVPLPPEDVARIIAISRPEAVEDGEEVAIRAAIPFKLEDRVRVKEGYFQNYEGEVSNVDERNGKVTVLINIFGRPNPVELDHWHLEKV
jgi:transcriptional antiterminator NusG